MGETKPFKISKQTVKIAFERVKANKGTYGIDEQTIEEFEKDLKNNLYKIWNRMSSGTYFPKPVKAVAIPKKNGKTRILGIPTVEDRVAQIPNIPWVRYADDGALNCVSIKQAKYIIKVLDKRFKNFGLELNLDKTKIVYCKDEDRQGDYENTSFDFLGYTFKPRGAKNKYGKLFINFLPAMSDKAQREIIKEVRSWKLQLKSDKTINDIANMFNRKIQGWINYYTHYYKSGIHEVLRYINRCLIKWARRKYKKLSSRKRAITWLMKIAQREPNLFAHWKFGIMPTVW